MFNRVTMLYLAIVFLSFCSLVVIKFHAHDLKEKVTNLEKSKIEEQNQIKVLQAEWAYLNKSDRLKYLANKYLVLNEAKSSKAEILGKKSQDKIHLVVSNESKEVAVIFQPKTNWRYKSREKIFTNRSSIRKNNVSTVEHTR